MVAVPVLRPRQVIKAFEKLGWEVARQRGSHIILTKKGHIATLSIPKHPEVARGTLHRGYRCLVMLFGRPVPRISALLQP